MDNVIVKGRVARGAALQKPVQKSLNTDVLAAAVTSAVRFECWGSRPFLPFRRLAVLILFILALCWVAHLEAANYKHWLNEEVNWIISRAEQEEFKKLEDDEAREAFVERFWDRRDPSPATQRNEYKDEHYRRLLYVNEMYREGMPGWRTDRGRVYILHCPPDSESFFRSRSTLSPLREVHHTERSPNTIVWIYHQLPNLDYYRGEIRLVFQPSTGLGRQSLALSESRTAQDRASQLSRKFFPATEPTFLEADMRYQLVMAGPPSIVNASGAELPSSGGSEMATYIDELLRSPGELLEGREQEKMRREKVRIELSESVKTQVTYAQVPFEVTNDAFYRDGHDWLVPLRLRIPLDQLQEDRIDIYAALFDERGQLFDEFVDSLSFDPDYARESGGDAIQYYNSFTAPSGEYDLKVVFRGLSGQKTGYREAEVNLQESRPEKIDIASLLLTNRVEVLPIGTEGASTDRFIVSSTDIVFNEARLLPNPSQRFRPEDYLFLYMQLWTPKGERKVSVNANFIKDGEIVKRLEPRIVEDSGHVCLEYGTAVPLEGFEPGNYILQIQAMDHANRTFDIHRARFAVLPSILPMPQPAEAATDQ